MMQNAVLTILRCPSKYHPAMQTNANFLKSCQLLLLLLYASFRNFLQESMLGRVCYFIGYKDFSDVRELSFAPGKIRLPRPKPEKTLQKIVLLLIAPKFGTQEVNVFSQSDRVSCHIRQWCWRHNFLKERVKWHLAVEVRASKLSISKRLFSVFSTKRMTI